MSKQTEDQEMAFVDELRKYENRWVAIVQTEGSEMIVGSGRDAVEAIADAEAKGFRDTVLFKVPPLNVALVPKA